MHAQVAALAGLVRHMKLDIFALKRQEGGLESLLQVCCYLHISYSSHKAHQINDPSFCDCAPCLTVHRALC